jgi:hypothetical protein
MKVYFSDEKTLVIEPENIPEGMALKVWVKIKKAPLVKSYSPKKNNIWGYSLSGSDESQDDDNL